MRPLSDYPAAWGGQRASVFPHQGPTDYAVIVEGVAPALATGGDTVEAVEAGFKYFDFLIGGQSDSGKYFVQCIPTTVSGVLANPSQLAQPAITYRLKWIIATTGAEAGAHDDLDAEIVRLLGIGAK